MTEPTPMPIRPPHTPRRSNGLLLALLGLALVAVLVLSTALAWMVYTRERPASGSSGSGFLRVELSGALSDEPARPTFFQDADKLPPNTPELAAAIRRAASDEDVKGLYLVLDGPVGGWASFEELRGAVTAFRASNKPCVAYSPSAVENGAYYLATACGKVVMAPAGVMLVNGLSFDVSYYKGTFDKLGVTPEFEHVGDFKSFIEAYERTGPSEPAAAAYEALLDSLYGQLVSGVAAGRGLSEDQIRAAIDLPTLSPTVAKQRGLIDALAWPDAMQAHAYRVGQVDWETLLAAPVTDDEAKAADYIDADDYVRDLRREESARGPHVAVVYAQGNIVSGGTEPSLFGDDGNLTDGEFSRWMKEAREDDDVKAVVVRVNSPGGSALAASLMWREVARTKAAGKPVVISMGDYAASGGYLMSTNANRIIAQPGTLTGSIGVFGGKFDLSGAYGKLGITQHSFQRGAMADLFSFDTPFDDAERAVFREYLTDFYGQFLTMVSDGRGMSRDEVHAVAQGRVWTGQQALERKLVDELGGLDLAVTRAAEAAGLPTDTPIRQIPRRKSFIEELTAALESSNATALVKVELPIDADVAAELSLLDHLAREGGIAAYLPGRPRVR